VRPVRPVRPVSFPADFFFPSALGEKKQKKEKKKKRKKKKKKEKWKERCSAKRITLTSFWEGR
jgi:hypothetical protein